MASDPARRESAQCSSHPMSSTQTRTCLLYSLACAKFVKLSKKLLHIVRHIGLHWSHQEECNVSGSDVCVCMHVCVMLLAHVCDCPLILMHEMNCLNI